jgi:hypothetical protein
VVVGVYLTRASQGQRIPYLVVRLLGHDGQGRLDSVPSAAWGSVWS